MGLVPRTLDVQKQDAKIVTTPARDSERLDGFQHNRANSHTTQSKHTLRVVHKASRDELPVDVIVTVRRRSSAKEISHADNPLPFACSLPVAVNDVTYFCGKFLAFVKFMSVCVAVSWIFGSASPACAQIEFEREPINYGQGPSDDPVAALQAQIDAGDAELEYAQGQGYLPAVLKALGVGTSSQVLVHSQTSFQQRLISPRRPRALYFNDESYVGWVQDGDVLEIMTTDPQQGEVFYTLLQSKTDKPEFIRDRGQCIVCHASSRTQDVPGGVVRSVFVNAGGRPLFGSGTYDIDHTSPFEKRWGGYYVTGTHGEMRHMGNVFAKDRSNPEKLDREEGANITELSDRLNVSPYLTPHSDLVALMVLEHQTQMQNLITRANYETRSAQHYDKVMNELLEQPPTHVSDSTKRRIASAGDKLVRYMLFAEEFPLTSPVAGTSEFAKEFVELGPRDEQGRSLRDFDLNTRMFKHPCSYLIYSRSFDGLPTEMKSYVSRRLKEILTGKDQSEEFSHLSAEDRVAILEILSETKPDLWAE